MKEIWRDIKGYNGEYQVSNLGRVKSLKYNKEGSILKPCDDTKGYYRVSLYKAGYKHKNIRVHRLVALAFIPNINDGLEVNHMDGNKSNNRLDNLEWITHSGNIKHAYNTNLMKSKKGIENPSSKLTEKHVIEIKKMIKDGKLLQREIAKIYGVDRGQISSIKTGKTWTHIKD